MPISPELLQIPDFAVKFTKAGLTSEIILDIIRGHNGRNFLNDSKRILTEFEKKSPVKFEGLENLQESGLIAFNHPENDVLFSAFLSLVLKISETTGKNVSVVMSSEIEMKSKYNEKTALPGSIPFIERFHRLYGSTIISTPTVPARKDYLSGRAIALRKVIERLKDGQIVAIAPEGHTEINKEMSPVDTYHDGSGNIARLAASLKLPTVPIGIWKDGDKINIKIGSPLYVFPQENKVAVYKLMKSISENLPLKHRGPFKI